MDELIENIRAQMADVETTLGLLGATLGRARKEQAEWMAIAGFTCNVYMGVENILKNALRAKRVKVVLSSASSHRDLLDLAAAHGLVTKDMRRSLDEYRGLRHVIHHGYGFRLSPTRLEPLASAAPAVWGKLRRQIERALPGLHRKAN
jgi:hypothetical protein